MRSDPPAGMSDLDRLLAYEEIRQLAARYALAVDARDLDSLVELFVDDVKAMGGKRGRDALREVFDEHLRADRVSILHIGGHVIDFVDSDHATGTVYCTCEMGDDQRWARQAIAYEDRYERRKGRWYFARRDHLLFYGVEVPERPMGQAPADWPASAIGRGTVPFAWPTYQRYWSGVDDPLGPS
jgi:ketosteroid isomerase-like protein